MPILLERFPIEMSLCDISIGELYRSGGLESDARWLASAVLGPISLRAKALPGGTILERSQEKSGQSFGLTQFLGIALICYLPWPLKWPRSSGTQKNWRSQMLATFLLVTALNGITSRR